MAVEANAVKCTHCGTQTSNTPVYTGYGYPVEHNEMRFVECLACGMVIVVDMSSERVVWPLAADCAPEDVPPAVAEAYRDATLALAAGSKIGALMAMRTMGVRMLRDKGISKFSELASKGIITQAHYDVLNQNRLWANVFGHKDISTERLDVGQIAEMFKLVGLILETIYTQPKAVERFIERTKEFQQETSR